MDAPFASGGGKTQVKAGRQSAEFTPVTDGAGTDASYSGGLGCAAKRIDEIAGCHGGWEHIQRG
jgi:hypothetical protein